MRIGHRRADRGQAQVTGLPRPALPHKRARYASQTIRPDRCSGVLAAGPGSCKHVSSHDGVCTSLAAVGVTRRHLVDRAGRPPPTLGPALLKAGASRCSANPPCNARGNQGSGQTARLSPFRSRAQARGKAPAADPEADRPSHATLALACGCRRSALSGKRARSSEAGAERLGGRPGGRAAGSSVAGH